MIFAVFVQENDASDSDREWELNRYARWAGSRLLSREGDQYKLSVALHSPNTGHNWPWKGFGAQNCLRLLGSRVRGAFKSNKSMRPHGKIAPEEIKKTMRGCDVGSADSRRVVVKRCYTRVLVWMEMFCCSPASLFLLDRIRLFFGLVFWTEYLW